MPQPHHNTQQQQQQQQPPQPIGRSQSAFNFLLSKAKIPFSSSSSSTLNTSNSLSSLSGANDDPFIDSTNHVQYHRQLQQQYPAAHGPSMASLGRERVPPPLQQPPQPLAAMGNLPRSSMSDPYGSGGSVKMDSYASRLSMSDETSISSPTKRGFFGGMARERKASNASAGKASLASAKNGYGHSHSPLGRRLRQDSTGSSSYALYSKSQSDLHARAEFPSPNNASIELPKMPLPYAHQNAHSAERGQYLQSPSPAISYSRSVDDLASGPEQASSPPFINNSSSASPSPHPGHPGSALPLPQQQQHGGGNWGEQGLVSGGEWRPSDMGTLASPSAQLFYRDGQGRSPSGSARSDATFGQAPLSAAPSHQAGGLWPVMPPPATTNAAASGNGGGGKADANKHARKSSKLNNLGSGRDAAAHVKGAVAGTLAMSLGLAGIGNGNSNGTSNSGSAKAANEPVPLPAGAVLQGFLSRNTQISLSLAQLTVTEHSKGKDKEKDISKGWKPYRVVLQDGKLFFYKPPSNISDEVKALFPTTIVWAGNGRNSQQSKGPGSGTSYARELGVDPGGLINSGLSKTELLLATSSSTTKDGSSAQSSPSFGPLRYKGLAGRRTPVRADSSTSILTNEPDPVTPPAVAVRVNPSDAWARPARHPALSLVEVAEPPNRWIDRIESATAEALADEFVRATQLPEVKDEEAVKAQMDAFVVTALLSTAPFDSPRGSAAFVGEVARLAPIHLESSDESAATGLQQRLTRMIELSIDLGVARSQRGYAESLVHLRELAQRIGLDADIMVKLDGAQSGQPMPSPTDWFAADPRKLNGSRLELEKMFTAHAITGELLLKLDPLEVAQQIQAFHSDRLHALVGQPSVSALDLIDPELRASTSAFTFDSQLPHYLTQLVLTHLLGGPDAEPGASSAVFNQSGARHRASLLRHWIAIASCLLNFGDVAGWLALAVALCSRSVTRLEQTWRYLAEGDRLLVAREWAPQLARASWVEGINTQVRPIFTAEEGHAFVQVDQGKGLRVLPFLGNASARLMRGAPIPTPSTISADGKGDHSLDIAGRVLHSEALLKTARQWSASWRADKVASTPIAAIAEPIVEYQVCLQAALQEVAAFDPASLMERSFRLEPKALGNIGASSSAAVATRAATAAHALVPLLFPMPLPHLSLLDAGKVQKDALGSEKRAKQAADPCATITAKTWSRPGLNGSPLIRSSAFSSTLASRGGKASVFAGIAEWNQDGGGVGVGSPSSSIEDPANLIRVGSELVLRTLQEPSLSVPSSPMAGKRFSQDFGRSRPLSQVSKRSSLPASNRSSVVEVVVPVQVVVRAATLERMIDILVMGVQHINVKSSDEAATAAAIEGAAPRRTRLSMDMESYRSTFLATFRSLCSPRNLFEHLQKRFATALNASKEMALLDTYQISSQYPSWMTVKPAGSHVEPVDWEVVYRIRMGVVATLRLWIDRFPQDFADDDALHQRVHAFIREPGMEDSADDPDQAKVSLAIAQVNGMFVQSIMGANARSDEKSYALSTPVYASGSIDAVEIDFDAVSSEQLVDFLESIATVFFDKIVQRDLLVASELFEKQALHPTAWYAARHSDSQPQGGGDDTATDKPINSMYSLLDVLKTPGSGSKDPTLQQRLPAAVRDALAAQSLLRGWVAIHIIERNLGVQRRQARLEKLLDAVWICRARMSRLRGGGGGGGDDSTSTLASQEGSTPFRETTVGSFVECAILGSLTSSESRIFLRTWQGVALGRSGSGDSLADLFPLDVTPPLRAASAGASTPDVGWILSCLAEAATRAATAYDAADVGLVDFEQRRTVWSLIEGSVRVRPPCNSPTLIDLAGARLKAMQTTLSHVSWDRRAFREDAAREASQSSPIGPLANVRQSSSGKALPGLSRQQQEKMWRDRKALAALEAITSRISSISSRLSSMQGANDRALPQTSSTAPVNTTGPASTAATVTAAAPDKSTIRSRRMTLFGRAVRPLISDKSEAPQHVRSVEELMRMTPTQKPSLVAGLGGAQLAPWMNAQKSFVLHLTSEEGAKYLLQAPNQLELTQWYTHISRIAKERAPRRPADIRKGAAGRFNSQCPTVAPLYGVPLQAIVEREGSAVPMAIEKMFAEIEARGLREQGIYRISAAKSAVEGLRNALNKQPLESIDLSGGEYSDVHTIAGAIKLWLRDLPEPPITFASYDPIIAAERIENHDERLSAIREIIWALPKCHFDLLRRSAEHLARVVDEGTYNLMAPHNIGLVFGTSLLNPTPSPSSLSLGFGNLGKAAHIVKIIVTMHEWLFEPEPEIEAEAEPDAVGAEYEPERETPTAGPDASPFAGAETLHETAEEDEEAGDAFDEQARLGGRRDVGAAETRRSTAAMRRHTYMLGGLNGLGSEQLQQLREVSEGDESLAAGTSMQQSFNSESESLTPGERFDGLAPGAPGLLPSARRLLSSTISPLPALPDEDERFDGSAPSIILTSTDDREVPSSPIDDASVGIMEEDDVDADDSGDDDKGDDGSQTVDRPAAVAVATPGDLASPPTSPTNGNGNFLEVSSAAAAGQARPRTKRARDGYRDSVFSSYSIYADCFDHLSLAAAPTAAAAAAATASAAAPTVGGVKAGKADDDDG